jgi:hypothetical protein
MRVSSLTPHSRLMAFNGIGAEPVVNRALILPALYSVIVTGRIEYVLFWVPLNILHILGMTAEDSHTIIFSIISIDISLSYPYGLISTTSGKVLSIMAPCCTLDLVLMTLKLFNTFETGVTLAPYAGSSIKASTSKHLPTWVPCQIPHSPLMQICQGVL